MISSPFLAIRVLKQLARAENHMYPLGAEILENKTYMDDTASGGYTIEET